MENLIYCSRTKRSSNEFRLCLMMLEDNDFFSCHTIPQQ